MSDLAAKLSAALGGTYRIEQELGGGGMSRVFAAEEIGLGRRVVIKVLPPEMAAGVNEDRFRREIQLAAKLQHPHIVPLLTAGAAGELLYYVMPFIRGESLRAKLARESELPVSEAVRYLREVTDALAYAHGEGVVHRDIKPDNVMISGGHALVTDFGVAKAVSESTGHGSLTSMGLAIGTPAYMAPEQASGDPHVDHRADLYALGAMAFEMLLGRTPFTGSPQSLLAAHVTQAPESVSQLRPAVPPALNSVIMRCLEKRAADRWQQASELLPHFDSLLTPSTGGTIPTVAAYTVSDGTRAAIKRTNPARVFALFTLASVGVAGLIRALVTLLGLPTWVFFGALALLAAGLPIMMITARHERARAVARSTNSHLAAPTGINRLFTWENAMTGGGLAFAGLGVITIAYMAMRLAGVGAVGTLLAKGALEERDRIVLAEFDSRATDSTLGPAVTELLRTDLAQSRSVSVYDASQLTEAKLEMQLPRDAPVTFEVAREVATRRGLKAVLAGDITAIGNSLVVSARLVATNTGDVLWAGRETIADANELAPAIDRLSATLRERIGESLRSIRAEPPLVQMTTRSTEALRLFAQAERAQDLSNPEGGIALLRQAIERDSGFAMAYRKLGVLLRNNATDDTAAFMPAFRRAYELRDRLSARERFLAEAAYHAYVARDTASAIAAYVGLLERHPDDRVAGNNLAILYNALGRKAEALAVFKNSIRYGNAAATTYLNSIDLTLELEGRDSAAAHIERFAAAYPGNPRVDFYRGLFLLSLWNVDSADAVFTRLRNATGGNPRAQVDALNGLVGVAMLRGKLADAEELQRERSRLTHQIFPEADLPIPLSAHLELEAEDFHGYVLAEFVGDTAGALALYDRGVARVPLDRRDADPAGPVLNAALANARVGRAAQARALWRRWEALVPDSVRRDPQAYALSVRAVLNGAEGRTEDAARDIRLAREKVPGCQVCYLTDLAAIYRRAGMVDSATAAYERVLAAQTLGIDLHVPDLERMAALYEQKGDSANATKYYRQVADLWANADAVLQARVAVARQKGGSGPRP